jgi:hypothetical protein
LHKYDGRLEAISPGAPPAPVTLQELKAVHPVHAARNPLIVRMLTDLGHMRELGEGIPRMFDEMERAGCNPPEIGLNGSSRMHVMLRSEVVFDTETLRWLSRYDVFHAPICISIGKASDSSGPWSYLPTSSHSQTSWPLPLTTFCGSATLTLDLPSRPDWLYERNIATDSR